MWISSWLMFMSVAQMQKMCGGDCFKRQARITVWLIYLMLHLVARWSVGTCFLLCCIWLRNSSHCLTQQLNQKTVYTGDLIEWIECDTIVRPSYGCHNIRNFDSTYCSISGQCETIVSRPISLYMYPQWKRYFHPQNPSSNNVRFVNVWHTQMSKDN